MHRIRTYGILFTLLYILGIHKGYIALWQSPDPEPIRIFPVRSSLLPEADQEMLKAGIQIREDAQLHNLLEDYLS